MSKLNLNQELIEKAKDLAFQIADSVNEITSEYTTVATERAICRLLGVDGIDGTGTPLPNIIVEHLQKNNRLSDGVAHHLSQVLELYDLTPQEYAEQLANSEIIQLPPPSIKGETLETFVQNSWKKIAEHANKRNKKLSEYGDKSGPMIYVIVATGDIYEDITQAEIAARQGADVIAVIRSTAQSLLDYVPYGATTEGIGGTYATQKNFQLMRQALDRVGDELHRYIRLCNYCSGLCMPEIAAMGALEGLDMMLNDALYGILFRDINPLRTLIDQKFSRYINGKAGIIINTGEDNYLTTSDAVKSAPTVLASQFLNEAMALIAEVPKSQQGLGHAFEISPELKNGFLYELAQAQMTREIFPESPLKYMPPTKHITGNIFQANVQDALFNIVTILTKQSIHLLGMPTEAIHTPFLSDRFIALDNFQYIAQTMKDLGDEITFKPNGIIQQRANQVLENAVTLLERINAEGLFQSLEQGIFADTRRPMRGGRGAEGIIKKSDKYFNPFYE